MRVLRFFRLFRVWRSFAASFRLMRSPRVPLHLKLIAGGFALVILSPLNILGDIPLLGLFDDVALLGMLAAWFVAAAARHDAMTTIEGELVVAHARQPAGQPALIIQPIPKRSVTDPNVAPQNCFE
jgi:uncharacterized membrane protein YkvA (DUF1232 family)